MSPIGNCRTKLKIPLPVPDLRSRGPNNLSRTDNVAFSASGYKDGMTPRTKRILGKSIVVTIIAVVATFGLSFTARIALQMPIDWLSWVECTVIPILIGMPVGAYIFAQSETIQDTCDKLEKSYADLKEAHDRFTFVTSHDPMTGLLSRGEFIARMNRKRDEGECDTLLLIDPDHFSLINDKHGHSKGDETLVRIAKALVYTTRPGDSIGRLGGEEFGVLLSDVRKEQAITIAENIRRHVEGGPWVKGRQDGVRVTVSIGGAEIPRAADAEDILRVAGRCLFEAKQRGRNCVSFTHEVARLRDIALPKMRLE
ncbi:MULTISPECIES: GGDEF domain-containing protein [unclassified Mesorhizobium]|uniref:GGDEF domain-containing protein n=1 Tax=unclassified Mesorhizobium TaxID=325217 RepID=UPI001CC9652D|nr:MULTISPECIES: GGDEF domain-containing protein [unclassified Mesorhizobium]MBZ9845186.1 GGDEF domain-containing protein [Mesorhizobium sp. CA5]MBZ9862008.1 GGDEF domain-containing protein [Mesorhizobium sp. CA12]